MIGYNPSHLNKNETLLEAFHRVEAYLKANPQYQVYQSSATYQEGTQEYALGTIVVPEGSTVGKGDVVLFSNVYYAVITAVSETTFSVETATNFRGAQGVQGPKGDTGATGDKGETGLPALTYSKSVTLGPYQSFSTDLDGYNRSPQINDICLYVSPNTSQIINGIIEEIRPDTQQVIVMKKSTIYAKGEKGEPGGQGTNGKDGNATLLYSGELSESITTAEISQVTRPQNRGILVKDILISTAASTFGAMAQVTALPVGVTTVDVSFIGTLESGGGGGTTLNKYNVSLNYSKNPQSANSLLRKIILDAKYIKSARVAGELDDCVVAPRYNNAAGEGAIYGMSFFTGGASIVKYVASDYNNSLYRNEIGINSDGTVSISKDVVNTSALIQITYYNDVEITV